MCVTPVVCGSTSYPDTNLLYGEVFNQARPEGGSLGQNSPPKTIGAPAGMQKKN